MVENWKIGLFGIWNAGLTKAIDKLIPSFEEKLKIIFRQKKAFLGLKGFGL